MARGGTNGKTRGCNKPDEGHPVQMAVVVFMNGRHHLLMRVRERATPDERRGKRTSSSRQALATYRPTPAILIAGGVSGLLTQVALEGFSLSGPYLLLPVAGAVLAGTIYYFLVYGWPRRTDRPEVLGPWIAPRVDGAVERPALMAALQALLVDRDAPVVAVTTAVVGAGGFGKTTLVSQICGLDEIRSRFPGGLLWATIGQERTAAELAEILNDLSESIEGGSRRPQFSAPEQAGRHLALLLGNRPPMLLVVDDVWNEAQLAPFLYAAEHATLLVTTRIPACLPPNSRMVTVDEMSPDEARQLICRDVPDLPDGVIRKLLQLSGNWALLLAMINGALRKSLRGGADSAAVARDLIEQLEVGGSAVVNPRLQQSRDDAVKQTIAASVRLLSYSEPSLYFQLGIFAEDADIPLSLLTLLWGLTAAETRAFCEDLADLSLVRAYQRGSATLRLHDVIRDHLRSELGPRLPGTNDALLGAARSLLPEPAAEWWHLPRTQDYLWRQLSYHLREAGRADELTGLVLNLRWAEEKILYFGLPAYETDLGRVHSELADVLRRALARKGHLLGPVEPAHSHADLLVSRLGDVPELRQLTAAYAATLSNAVARLTNRWPIPPVDPALLRVVAGHLGVVTGCAISRDGSWLATAGADQTVRIWDTSTWTERAVLTGHSDRVTGCTAAAAGSWLATTGDDATVRVWDTHRWSAEQVLRGHTGAVLSGAVSRDGTWLATGDSDGYVRVWDTRAWTERRRFRAHNGGVATITVARDDAWLATAGSDHTVRIWDTERWSEIKVLRQHTTAITGCTVAQDGTWLATAGADGSVVVWDARQWRRGPTLSGHIGEVTGCGVSPDGRWLATTGTDHTVRIWDTRTWLEHSHMRGHTEAVTGCAFARDGAWLATTSADHNIRVWDTSRHHERDASYAQNRSVTSCAIEPDAGWLVTVGSDNIVCIWSADNPTVRATLPGHQDEITDCAIDPRGRWVASASADRTVRIWDTTTWGERARLDHPGAVSGCAIDPEGRTLATVGADGVLRLWSTQSWGRTGRDHGRFGPLARCAFSPDGTWLATTGTDGGVRVWDTASWKGHATLRDHDSATLDCAFSATGTWLATTSSDQTVRIWSTTTWDVERVLTGHGAAVSACAFSPDGAWLATTGGDNAVRIWAAATWTLAATMRTNGEPRDVSWFPDGRALCVGAVGGIYNFSFTPPGG
jgi:WD40 repeat protein